MDAEQGVRCRMCGRMVRPGRDDVIRCICGEVFRNPVRPAEVSPPPEPTPAAPPSPEPIPPGLRRCGDCGGLVSRAAQACPHCGAPPKVKQVANAVGAMGCTLVIVAVGLPFLLLLGGC